MKNEIYHVPQNGLDTIKKQLTAAGTWVAEINGNLISTIRQYLDAINEAFKFHTPARSLDGYLDWMSDLDWLHANAYALVITNFKNFMKDDPEKKKTVMWLFENDILPFWESGVEQYVVGGEAKPFNVYLVD